MIPPDPLFPARSASLVMKRPENKEEDHDDPEPADRDIQMTYSNDWLYSQSLGAVTNSCMKIIMSVSVPSDNLQY